MALISMPIDQIRPDPNQPRKIFSDKHLQGLMQSLETEGMINPIEIDKDGMIITGEQRWRAAKRLGWTKVPINLNESPLNEYQRLRRQLAENIHQNGELSMNPYDVAKGYERLLLLKVGKDSGDPPPTSKEKYGHIRGIANEVGVSRETVMDYMKLLEQPSFVIDNIKQGGKISQFVETYRIHDPSLKEEIQKKVAEGGFVTSKDVRLVSQIAKLDPQSARSMMLNRQQRESKGVNKILTSIVKLGLSLESVPLDKVADFEVGLVTSQLKWIKTKIGDYLNE